MTMLPHTMGLPSGGYPAAIPLLATDTVSGGRPPPAIPPSPAARAPPAVAACRVAVPHPRARPRCRHGEEGAEGPAGGAGSRDPAATGCVPPPPPPPPPPPCFVALGGLTGCLVELHAWAVARRAPQAALGSQGQLLAQPWARRGRAAPRRPAPHAPAAAILDGLCAAYGASAAPLPPRPCPLLRRHAVALPQLGGAAAGALPAVQP